MEAFLRSRWKEGLDKRIALPLRQTLAGLVLCLSATPGLTDYVDEWGPAIGSHLPPLATPDETGTVRTLDDLSGGRGLLLVLVRSSDW
jgi:hypothetical protein